MSVYLFTELILSNSNYLNYCLSEKGTLKTALACSMFHQFCNWSEVTQPKSKKAKKQTKKTQLQLLSFMSSADSPASCVVVLLYSGPLTSYEVFLESFSLWQ